RLKRPCCGAWAGVAIDGDEGPEWIEKRPPRRVSSIRSETTRSPGKRCRSARMARLTLLPAGPPHLRHLVPHLAVIPAQNSRHLLDREAGNEHAAQLAQLRIRPLFARVRRRLFVLSLGRLRIQDQCANRAEECFVLRMSRPGQEGVGVGSGKTRESQSR